MATTYVSAPHLYAAAHGVACEGLSRCFYCGAPCDGTHSTREHVKDTFTAWSSVAAPASEAVCEGCVLAMRDTLDVPMIDGTIKPMARAAVRMNSWIVTATSAVAASKAHMEHVRRVCLSPPPPPYAIVLSESGQTHQIYRAVVGRSDGAAVVNLECVPVVYRPGDLAAALETAGKLAACVGKPGLREFPVHPSLACKVFDRHGDAESLLARWADVGPTPLGRLAAWLSPNMEECKSAYPSDLD